MPPAGVALPYPDGCATYGLSERRCAYIERWARGQAGLGLEDQATIELLGDPECPDGAVGCVVARTMEFVDRRHSRGRDAYPDHHPCSAASTAISRSLGTATLPTGLLSEASLTLAEDRSRELQLTADGVRLVIESLDGGGPFVNASAGAPEQPTRRSPRLSFTRQVGATGARLVRTWAWTRWKSANRLDLGYHSPCG